MAFKHIKRPEEIPPKPVPAPQKDWNPESYLESDNGYHSLVVPLDVIDAMPEFSWRAYVYEAAHRTGYTGPMHEFFCRDVKETQEYGGRDIRFTWFVLQSRKHEDYNSYTTGQLRKWADYDDKDDSWKKYRDEERKAYDKETYDQLLAKDYWNALTDIDKKSRY